MTRAKSAALTTTDVVLDNPKKGLQVKKSTATLSTNAATRKRPALGDVSNVGKTEGLGAGSKDGKKPAAGKSALAKAAQPSRIQKASQVKPSRHVLKEKVGSSELKRPASGSGIARHPTKRRSKPTKQEDPEEELENVVPQSNVVADPEPTELADTKPERRQSVVAHEPEPVTGDEIANLDDEDTDDPLMVSEYVVRSSSI